MDRRALTEEANRRFREGRYPEAEAAYRELAQRFPNVAWGFIRYAECVRGDARAAERERAWREVIARFPGAERGYVELAHCVQEREGAARAREELLALRARAEHRGGAEHALARIAYAEGRYEDAAGHCASAIEAGIQGWETHFLQGRIRLAQERFTEAVAAFRRATELPGAAPRAYTAAIRAALFAGEGEAAAAFAEAFAAKGPLAPHVVAAILRAYVELRPAQAPEALRRLTGPAPQTVELACLVPEAMHAAGRSAEALDECARLEEKFPEVLEPRSIRARVLTGLSRWAEAAAAWDEALRVSPRDPAALAESAAVEEMLDGERASSHLARLLREWPRDENVLDAALRHAVAAARWRSAAALSERLLRLQPGRAALLLSLAEARYNLGESPGALEAIRAALGSRMNADAALPWLHRRLERLEAAQRNAAARAAALAVPSPVSPGPVDAVYTWVDSGDPGWLAKFRRYTGIDPRTETDPSANGRRYESFGEILLSLRALQAAYPEVRRIYIVTDEQRFDLSSLEAALRAKISFVDHRELLPAEEVLLPTFSSDLIEAFLHRIPGLSEVFLALNDDTFIGAPLFPRDLVDADGTPYLDALPHRWPADLDTRCRQLETGLDNHLIRTFGTLAIFRERFGYSPGYLNAHQASILSKRLCELTLEVFAEHLEATLFKSRVREAHTPRTCLLRDWVGLHHGLLTVRPPGALRHMMMFQGFAWEHASVLMSARPHLFCLNNLFPSHRQRFSYLAQHYLDGAPPPDMPLDDFLMAAEMDGPQAKACS